MNHHENTTLNGLAEMIDTLTEVVMRLEASVNLILSVVNVEAEGYAAASDTHIKNVRKPKAKGPNND